MTGEPREGHEKMKRAEQRPGGERKRKQPAQLAWGSVAEAATATAPPSHLYGIRIHGLPFTFTKYLLIYFLETARMSTFAYEDLLIIHSQKQLCFKLPSGTKNTRVRSTYNFPSRAVLRSSMCMCKTAMWKRPCFKKFSFWFKTTKKGKHFEVTS